jgi:ribosomal protein S20
MNIWQKVGLSAAALALTGGTLFASVAYAQTTTPTPDQEEQTAPAAQATPAEKADRGEKGGWFFGRFFGPGRPDGHGMGRGMGRGMMGYGLGQGGPMGGPLRKEQLAIAAEVLGMPPEDLQAAVEAGQSLREIAEVQGMDEAEFEEAFHAAAIERIDQAVADGDLTEKQAAALKERIANGAPLMGLPGGRGWGRGAGPMAEILGDPRDLLAEATGMTVDELETALQTTIQSRLEAAVEAGDLTQEQADRLLERLDEGLPFFGRPLR